MRDDVAGGGEPGHEAGRHDGHLSKVEGRIMKDEMGRRLFRGNRYSSFILLPSYFRSGVAGECELRGEELVGRSLPRRPDIWAAQQRSPTKFCFGLRASDFNLNP